jgi:hypothetical protein
MQMAACYELTKHIDIGLDEAVERFTEPSIGAERLEELRAKLDRSSRNLTIAFVRSRCGAQNQRYARGTFSPNGADFNHVAIGHPSDHGKNGIDWEVNLADALVRSVYLFSDGQVHQGAGFDDGTLQRASNNGCQERVTPQRLRGDRP